MAARMQIDVADPAPGLFGLAALERSTEPWRLSPQAARGTGTTCGRHPIAAANALAHTRANASRGALG